MFVDKVQVTIKAGDGGDGIVSWRHEKFIDKGGPDGGDGGNGGDVILRASRNQNTLATFRYQKLLKADAGSPGGKRRKHGKSGEDLIVPVPVGTVVYGQDGGMLADLSEDDEQTVIAMGGKGGFGNAHFTSSTRQAPKIAEKGEPGEQLSASLELKMIADVGLVGLPNAGKSTLLSVISNARPEIADYPFTTLTPNLGVVDVDKKTTLLFADIPGLIEGASKGKGLGDEFLRHVERTAVLVHLIDSYNDNVAKAYKTVAAELKHYAVDLSVRPQVVVLTKIEGLDEEIVADKLAELRKAAPKGTPLLAISSQSKQGVKELLYAVKERVDTERTALAKKAGKAELPVYRLIDEEDTWKVVKADSGFMVTGPKIERFARRTHFNTEAGEQRVRDIMTKMGIMNELNRQNVEAGQTIVIGDPPIGRLEY